MNSRRVSEAIRRAKEKLLTLPDDELKEVLARSGDSDFAYALLYSGALDQRESEREGVSYVTITGTSLSVHDLDLGISHQLRFDSLGQKNLLNNEFQLGTVLWILSHENTDDVFKWAA